MRTISITVIALSLVVTCGASAANKQDTITVKGSDTMVTLSAHWAESFMAANPGKTIAVTGGGSGVGISALLGGTCDIANASRDVTRVEKQKGLDAGVVPVETNVALDGIALVVNPANPLSEATVEQLRRIYTGEATNWKGVGGQEGKIIVLSRETSSGTYVFFQEHVLQKRDYATSVRLMPATSAIIESVASDKTAIGYVGLGYAEKAKDRVKVLKIKADDKADAVAPSEETVRAKTYPISRPLHCYTNGKPAGLAGKFIEYCLSPEGQKIVREEGYIPLK